MRSSRRGRPARGEPNIVSTTAEAGASGAFRAGASGSTGSDVSAGWFGSRPWKNEFAEDGGPTSIVRLWQGMHADPGTQAEIACSSGPTPRRSAAIIEFCMTRTFGTAARKPWDFQISRKRLGRPGSEVADASVAIKPGARPAPTPLHTSASGLRGRNPLSARRPPRARVRPSP